MSFLKSVIFPIRSGLVAVSTEVVFHQCKLTGTNFAESYLRDCTFTDCIASMSSFSSTNLKAVSFDHCQLEDSEFYEVTWKNLFLSDNQLTGSNWFRTSLKGLDFTINSLHYHCFISRLFGRTDCQPGASTCDCSSSWFADQRLDQRIRLHSAMSIQTDKTRLMIKAISHPKTEWVNGSLRFIPKNPVTIVGTVRQDQRPDSQKLHRVIQIIIQQIIISARKLI